jgi:hypothetical protein
MGTTWLMRNSGIGWRGIEPRIVLLPSSDRFRHSIVNLTDGFLGSVAAELLFVLSADNWERVHDVRNGVVLIGERLSESF